MMFASFWLTFSQKLANIPPGQNVGNSIYIFNNIFAAVWALRHLRFHLQCLPACLCCRVRYRMSNNSHPLDEQQ